VSDGAAGTRSGTKNAVELSTEDPDGPAEQQNTSKRQTTAPGPPEEFTQVDSALMDKHRVALDGGDVLYMRDVRTRRPAASSFLTPVPLAARVARVVYRPPCAGYL